MTRILFSAITLLFLISVTAALWSSRSVPRAPEILRFDGFTTAQVMAAQRITLVALARVGRPLPGPLETCWARRWATGYPTACPGDGQPLAVSGGR